jgi:hypothetical protein
MPDAEESAPLDDALSTHLLQFHVPQRVQSLLTCTAALMMQSTLLPRVATDTLRDLVNKAGTLLGHLLANLLRWQPPTTLWNDLVTLLFQQLSVVACAATSSDQDESAGEGVEGITTAMIMALQAKRVHVVSLDPLIPMLLKAFEGMNEQQQQQLQSPVMIRNLVCLLGLLLCATPHSAKLNHEACRALMQVAEASCGSLSSSMICAEVCNVLMDLYGSDDCHKQVFVDLHVLNYFQRSLPLLQQDDAETALNAERFIRYMSNSNNTFN